MKKLRLIQVLLFFAAFLSLFGAFIWDMQLIVVFAIVFVLAWVVRIIRFITGD